MQSPILEIRDKNGRTLVKNDLYSIVHNILEAYKAYARGTEPVRILLDGVDVEPPPPLCADCGGIMKPTPGAPFQCTNCGSTSSCS